MAALVHPCSARHRPARRCRSSPGLWDPSRSSRARPGRRYRACRWRRPHAPPASPVPSHPVPNSSAGDWRPPARRGCHRRTRPARSSARPGPAWRRAAASRRGRAGWRAPAGRSASPRRADRTWSAPSSRPDTRRRSGGRTHRRPSSGSSRRSWSSPPGRTRRRCRSSSRPTRGRSPS